MTVVVTLPVLLIGYIAFKIDFAPLLYLVLSQCMFELLALVFHSLYFTKFKERTKIHVLSSFMELGEGKKRGFMDRVESQLNAR